MGIDNYFDFDGENVEVFMDDGTLKENSPTPHSGNRDVCLDVDSGYRNEFNLINMENLVDNELFISVWLYLPEDFQMSLSGENWLEIIDPLFTASPAYAPYFAVMVTKSTLDSGYGLRLVQRDVNNVFSVLQEVSYFDLPVGRWFNLQYYVYRDATEGVIKVWIDDPARQNDPILEKNSLHMTNPEVGGWFTTIAKIYHDILDESVYRLWVDDLEVWNGLPPPPLHADVWSDKGDNLQLPSPQGCLGSYKLGSTLQLYCTVNKDAYGKLTLTDPTGKATTLVSEQLSVKTYSLAPKINGPAGYWRVDFAASTNDETSTDGFQFCAVEDYVTFNGEILNVTKSPTAGNLYQVRIENVISDPTSEMQAGQTVQVSWNYSLADEQDSLMQGDFVEVHGGYASSAVGAVSGEVVFLANSDDDITEVEVFTVSIDPAGGQIYVDNSSSPITSQTSYQWLSNSMHILFAETTSDPLFAQKVFSKWSDGDTSNPRTIIVTGPASYTAVWKTVIVPTPTPVSISVISPTNQTYATVDVPLTLKVQGEAIYLGYSLDGQEEVAITQNVTLRDLSAGTHSITVTAIDSSENVARSDTVYFTVSPEKVSYSVTVDPNGGEVYVDNSSTPITTKTNYTWTKNSVHTIFANATVDPSGARLTFSQWTDGDEPNPRTITVVGDAVYSALWSYVPVGTELSVLLSSPENGTVTLSNVPLTLNINGSASWITYNLDDADNVTIAGNTTLSGLTEGPHMLRVYVKDYFTDKVEVVSAYFTVEIPKEPIDWTVTIVLVAVTAAAVVIIILWRHPKTAKKVKSLFSPKRSTEKTQDTTLAFKFVLAHQCSNIFFKGQGAS